MSKNPYAGSPYDAAGMPLGAETVDYDNKNDVAKHTVKDKVVEPVNINELSGDYKEPKITTRKHINPTDWNSAIEVPGHDVNTEKDKHVGKGIPELQPDAPKKVDIQEEADHPDEKEDFLKALDNA